jgi:hypothetical protein
MLQALLVSHKIEQLSKYDLSIKQVAMSDLGVCNMVMVLISKARNPSDLSDYVKVILPEVM